VVCLFLSIFSFIGYFKIDAWFITYFCGFVKGLLGWGYWLFPPMLMLCAIELAFSRQKKIALKIVSALMTPVFLGGLLHLFLGASADMTFEAGIIRRLYETGVDMQSGGVVSGILAMGFKSAVSVYGAAPVFLLGFLFFALNAFGLTIRNLIDIIREHHDKAVAYRAQYVPEEPEPSAAPDATSSPAPETLPPPVKGRRGRRAIDIPLEDVNAPAADYAEERVGFFNTRPRVKTPDQFLESGFSPAQASPVPDSQPPFDVLPPLQPPTALETAELTSDSPAGAPSRKIKRVEVQAETEEISKKIEKEQEFSPGEYRFPPLNLLESAASAAMDGSEEVSLNRERLENTIRSFGVSGAIKGVTRGPTVTRYDLELDQGVKLAKLMGLAGDLALSLGVLSVRIAPIPDKISTVGIEVPNKFVSTVLLRDIIASPSFRNAQSKLSFAVGKDIGGSAIIGNISKLPHLLIAGTTGSGKSVCMNSLILSLLYKSTPEEVRLIMIDPKMVELGVYNGIPHLFVPVVTDPKKAAGALQWAVVEMLKRYRYFSEVGVRDLTGYNIYQKNRGEPTMPRVVIVIDELADLMLVASKEVEETICRVAQMGRAAGMHLVIATQRPSADVITGLMKANIPSRIAFAVSSAMESRIILDNSGADKLVGAGDMLYSPLGGGKPMRVQGAFVTDEEREKVIAFVKESSEADYSEDILAQIEKAAEDKPTPSEEETNNTGFGADYDELLPQAVEVILETKQASVSMLQRRLKLGYARAARVVDQMEELGIVGPFEGSKPRQLLMTKQQWQELQLARGVAPVRPDTDEVSFSEYSDAPEEEWKD
jgi:S-DNA-T family DNA segregation ATPase FtsK/SpoIIIE